MTRFLVKDLVKTNVSCYNKSDNWEYINYLDTGNLTNNVISEVVKLIPGEDTIPSRAKRKVKQGDILYSTVRPNQCHFGYMKNLLDNMLVSTGYAVLEPLSDKICGKYLYYYLTQREIVEYLHSIAEGTVSTYPSIQPKDIEKISIDMPDLDEQKAIASVLSTYDDLIEKNNRKIQILQDMAEELYKEWFVRFRFPGYNTAKFENGIPKDWGVDKIKNKVNRLPFNKLYKEADLEKEGNVIVIDQSEKEYLGFHNNEPSHVASIDEPICLFGDHSCKFQLMSEPFSLGENVVPFKGLGVNSYYLFYATYHIIETEEYKRHWGLFTSKKIFIPPEPLQDKFAEFIKDIQQQTNTIIKCQRLLIKQRDLLLPRLMSGKLEVKVK